MTFAVVINEDQNCRCSEDTYILSLSSGKYSTIYSSLYDLWRRFSAEYIAPVFEDLFVLGLSVFAVDKRMPRTISSDNWSRNITVQIPIHNIELWSSVREHINMMLGFLSGDKWDVHFYETEQHYAMRPIRQRSQIDISGFDSVCLFSGGLDSFCGAIFLANQGKAPLLLGHNEYPKLREKQYQMARSIHNCYPEQGIRFFDFSANSRAPHNCEGVLIGSENTCRSRSFLFLTAAISIAGLIGNGTKVYIPENGFISINVPLTKSRLGSCSTRTTHPFFVKCFSKLLHSLGLNHEVENPFQFLTKREIVDEVKDSDAFIDQYASTISCSHPCNPRWYKRPYPCNCGYCYPCIIRKSSLLSLEVDQTRYDEPRFNIADLYETDKESANDMRAVLASIHRYRKDTEVDLVRLLQSTGPINAADVPNHLRVYKATMEDLQQLMQCEYGIGG